MERLWSLERSWSCHRGADRRAARAPFRSGGGLLRQSAHRADHTPRRRAPHRRLRAARTLGRVPTCSCRARGAGRTDATAARAASTPRPRTCDWRWRPAARTTGRTRALAPSPHGARAAARLLEAAGIRNPARAVGLVAAATWPSKAWPAFNAGVLAQDAGPGRPRGAAAVAGRARRASRRWCAVMPARSASCRRAVSAN